MRSIFTSLVALAAASLVAASPLDGRDTYFKTVFQNETAATQSSGFMTFTLVEPGVGSELGQSSPPKHTTPPTNPAKNFSLQRVLCQDLRLQVREPVFGQLWQGERRERGREGNVGLSVLVIGNHPPGWARCDVYVLCIQPTHRREHEHERRRAGPTWEWALNLHFRELWICVEILISEAC